MDPPTLASPTALLTRQPSLFSRLQGLGSPLGGSAEFMLCSPIASKHLMCLGLGEQAGGGSPSMLEAG